MIPAVDMFCGLGGWTTGAARTGAVAVRHAVNHYEHAIRWHSRAHPTVEHHEQDCHEFPWESIASELDGGIVIASPSCKGWSSAGQPARQGTGGNGRVNIAALMGLHQGYRNTSWAVLSAAEMIKPQIVLVENVDRMLRWPLFPAWLQGLELAGYRPLVHKLNAYQYGGAQDRERVVITAGRGFEIPLADTWGAGPGAVVGDCLDELDGPLWHPISSKPNRTRDLIRAKQRESGLSEGLLNNAGDGVRMRALDRDPAPTLTTKSGSQLMHVQGDRVRILNPRELARIQGFYDDTPLPRNREIASILIGNAIPVELAEGVLCQAMEKMS